MTALKLWWWCKWWAADKLNKIWILFLKRGGNLSDEFKVGDFIEVIKEHCEHYAKLGAVGIILKKTDNTYFVHIINESFNCLSNCSSFKNYENLFSDGKYGEYLFCYEMQKINNNSKLLYIYGNKFVYKIFNKVYIINDKYSPEAKQSLIKSFNKYEERKNEVMLY